MNERQRMLPQWIWHKKRENERKIELVKKFVIESAAENIEFGIALTGAVEVELDGSSLGAIKESAANVCAFQRIVEFPRRLEAGEHILRLHIECKNAMPIAPISIHLQGRLVGCIAYLSSDNFELCTDDSWLAGEEQAVSVCLLGEEPYGDLEDGPEWFVEGGFRDIIASPLSRVGLISANGADIDIHNNNVRMSGKGKGRISIPEPLRNDLHIFYHVRKQTEWRAANMEIRKLKLAALPVCLLDLHKEYNMRFHLKNLSAVPLTIIWNGAESLPELEHYEGLITEVIHLEAGETRTALPQGLRYLRLYVLADDESAFELEWRGEEVGVPLNQVGTIQTDSVLLKNIFDISMHTNRVCHQIGLWDGIKRDRLNWTYDFYMAAKADYVLWDDLAVLRRSIVELGSGTPDGYWMNDIPAYTLWWLNNIWEYYLYTGDKEFVLSLEDEIIRHCRLVEKNIDPASQQLLNVSATLIEWVAMKPEESVLNMQALFRMTGDNLRKLKSFIPELTELTNWGHPRLEEGSFLSGEQLITKLLGIMSGYVSEQAGEDFLSSYQVQDPITPLSAYWLAECYSQFGLQDKAWEAVSLVWGKMLGEGATTCWESVTLKHDGDFHDALTTYTNYNSYRISLCHSWAGTPVHWIMSRVLGVVPLEPGYRKIAFRPQRLNDISICVGSIPTPFGAIEAGWDEERSSEYILRLPDGITV
ncbi:hypothetical protein BK133_16795 [Paenibacillus sp. FSL H8-0548]|uniref:alpha-L-rhamnosidase C-terminal domain-containing protein n=1 Tax=Paenibacillus sp. FSL H8-0548 TaxID=1920422 RepID=UPI00096F43F0|nr:alpha-L-rhamnosidase C-terminal domain-containing protein [Paenibacillus sp. FSL H8-0548]OMF30791.1 hypothetical protein BK133_16795 [Paenibacillus sp. FSL H8-0548]